MDTTVAGRFIGARIPRVEDARLLTGRGCFVDDVRRPGLLHAAFVRSPYAAASIVAFDASVARSFPGVVAVCSADDLVPWVHDCRTYLPEGMGAFATGVAAPQFPLARHPAFVGDPVAIVVARSRRQNTHHRV